VHGVDLTRYVYETVTVNNHTSQYATNCTVWCSSLSSSHPPPQKPHVAARHQLHGAVLSLLDMILHC
jgi:hypothetical protein